MKKKNWSLLYSMLIGCFVLSAHASDLIDVYRQSLENDPIFKAAYSTFMANAEAIAQARAALLPQIGITAQATRNVLNTDVPGPDGLDGSQFYGSNQWRLNATQAIFNYQAWAQVQQAKASVKAAHATFNDAAQNLILRTAKAYFDVLLSRDTLNFVEAKKRANKRQLEQAQQRFNVGLDTITSVYEAKAAYDQSVADVISAQNNQINQNENLRKLTNHVYDYLAPLRNSKIPLIKPEPDDVNDWVATGIKQNYNLFAAKYNLQAARENVKAQSAGNWPTISLLGTGVQINNSSGDSSNFFVPDHQLVASAGIAVNFPVVQGGLTQANTRRAQYNFQTYSEQLEQVFRNVTVNSTIAFNTIKDGISKVKADRQAVISRQNSLDSTDAQFEVGTRTMVDVVTAQQRLFEAQQQLASDQYGLILAILNLKYFAGTLSVTDLEEINAWLDTTRIKGLPLQPKKS
jgi:outer membrane protein